MSRWAKAAQLSLADWVLLVRASFWLLLADCGLRLGALGSTQALLHRGVLGGAPRCGVAEQGDVQRSIARISYLVDVAAQYHLVPMACLPRALVLRRLLAQAGVSTELRIGVRKEGSRLLAHAWLERQGQPVGEPRDPTARFAALHPAAHENAPSWGPSAVPDLFPDQKR